MAMFPPAFVAYCLYKSWRVIGYKMNMIKIDLAIHTMLLPKLDVVFQELLQFKNSSVVIRD